MTRQLLQQKKNLVALRGGDAGRIAAELNPEKVGGCKCSARMRPPPNPEGAGGGQKVEGVEAEDSRR